MRIVIENPKATIRVKATASYQTALIYANRISRLDECRHLASNDPLSFYIKMRILTELLHPNNTVCHFKLVNPVVINSTRLN